MEKSPFVSPRFFLATGRYLGNIEEELKEMKNFEEYDRIYSTITKILNLIPLTDTFMKTLEKDWLK